MPGVDAVIVKDLNIDLLAPGGNPGRIVVFTESAINKLREGKLFL